NLDRLADPVAEVVELRPADGPGLLHHDPGDPRRMDREDPLDALTLHDPPDGERLAHPGVLAGDHIALENLDAFLLPIEDLLVDFHPVADPEVGNVGFEVGLFNQPEKRSVHDPPLPFGAVMAALSDPRSPVWKLRVLRTLASGSR